MGILATRLLLLLLLFIDVLEAQKNKKNITEVQQNSASKSREKCSALTQLVDNNIIKEFTSISLTKPDEEKPIEPSLISKRSRNTFAAEY